MTTTSAAALLAALALSAPLLATPAARADGASAAMIAGLNVQREANGIPGGIVEDPAWSEACAKHMTYVAAHGLTHDEDASFPEYTAEGAWAAATSVLASGAGSAAWTDGAGPWENAPIHLMQLLAPSLSVTGAAPGCMVTWDGYQRPAPPTPVLVSYPGDARTGVPFEQTASEMPMVPGDAVGLPEGTTTGPHLYVLAWGANRGRLTDAALTGPDGPVEIRTVDNATTAVGSYLPAGGIMIPARALAPLTTYRAQATFLSSSKGATALTRSWTFTTRGLDPRLSVGYEAGRLTTASRSGAPIAVAIRRLPSGTTVFQRAVGAGRTPLALPGARYEICAEQAVHAPYEGARVCEQKTFRSIWRVGFAHRTMGPTGVTLALRLPPEAAGVVATLTVRPLRRRCGARPWAGAPPRCRLVAGRAVRRAITLRAGLRIRVPLRRGERAQVRLGAGNVAAGELLGTVPVAEATVRR